ncbi:MAG: antibiotic biosynthesis monooxygenase [bacterium]
MIARIWHGATTAADAKKYLDYLNGTGVLECRATEGNQGVYVLSRIEGNTAHFLFISLWNSYDAIKKFAGAEIDKARYYPEDKEFLLELEPTVAHYEASAFI